VLAGRSTDVAHHPLGRRPRVRCRWLLAHGSFPAGYDEPETLLSSTTPACLMSPDGGHVWVWAAACQCYEDENRNSQRHRSILPAPAESAHVPDTARYETWNTARQPAHTLSCFGAVPLALPSMLLLRWRSAEKSVTMSAPASTASCLRACQQPNQVHRR
jgi:hypothetical protein